MSILSNQPTPETDAVARWMHTNGLYRVITTGVVDVDFARNLERERDEARKEACPESEELCRVCNIKWRPSLVESSVCIFCIAKQFKAERDQLRKVCDELATELQCINKIRHVFSIDKIITAYNNLPHVKERNQTK